MKLYGYKVSTDAFGGGSSSGSSSGSSGSSNSGPSQPKDGYDHTFVRSDSGDRWNCYGRDQDPAEVEICVGGNRRDVRYARCVGGLPIEYGLKMYGVDGVCHTAADRLLSSARMNVSSASGYAESLVAFGYCGIVHDPLWPAKYGTCKTAGFFPVFLAPVELTREDWAISRSNEETDVLFGDALLGLINAPTLSAYPITPALLRV